MEAILFRKLVPSIAIIPMPLTAFDNDLSYIMTLYQVLRLRSSREVMYDKAGGGGETPLLS